MTVAQCEKVLEKVKGPRASQYRQDFEQPLIKFSTGIIELSWEQTKNPDQVVSKTAEEAIQQMRSILIQKGLATWEELG